MTKINLILKSIFCYFFKILKDPSIFLLCVLLAWAIDLTWKCFFYELGSTNAFVFTSLADLFGIIVFLSFCRAVALRFLLNPFMENLNKKL